MTSHRSDPDDPEQFAPPERRPDLAREQSRNGAPTLADLNGGLTVADDGEAVAESVRELVFEDALRAEMDGDTATITMPGLGVEAGGTGGEVTTLDAGENIRAQSTPSGARLDVPASQMSHQPDRPSYNMESSRPLLSTDDLKFYVGANGNDDNSGISSDEPLATLEEVGARLPYYLFHGCEVVVLANDGGDATKDDDQGVIWPPIRVNFVGDESAFLLRGEDDSPESQTVRVRGFNQHFRGAENSNLQIRNIDWQGPVKNYDGVIWLENCNITADTRTTGYCIGGYQGRAIANDCTFSGSWLTGNSQGKTVILNNCDGSIANGLSNNGGLSPNTIFLNNCGGLRYNSPVQVQDAGSIVVEDGELLHPRRE